MTRRDIVKANPVKWWLHATVILALLITWGGWARGAKPRATPASFAVASVHFEQNATDGDMEVVFQVKGTKDGLAELNVVSPDRRTVVAFKSPDASTLGIRQFRFESPEPTDIKSLRAAYPEGVYRFYGKTVSGTLLAGKSKLSHRLPAATKVVKPAPKATHVPVKGLEVSWSAVTGVAWYVVAIERSDSNANFTATVPASATSLAVPDGLLSSGQEYSVSIGTVARDGNISFVEATFTTDK